MKAIEHLLLPGNREERTWKRYSLDTFIAAFTALMATGIIYGFRLYPRIPNISLLYLLVVLGLASTRGRYAAIIASLVAVFSFDYFLVPPLYTFSIGAFEEWLALFVFLLTAIITGQLASALKQRAEEASYRESEMRILYELVRATASEEDIGLQLRIVACAIVENFASVGVRDCAILLSDPDSGLLVRASAVQPREQVQLSEKEIVTAKLIMKQEQVVDLYDGFTFPPSVQHGSRAMQGEHYYARMIPIQVGPNGVGVVRLLIAYDPLHFPAAQSPGVERERLQPRATFFWAFLNQAALVIERARLRGESLQFEVLKRTDELRSALLSSVSHDLRTPLSAIKASASSLLEEDVQWDEETRHSFAMAIESEADRLNRLVSNLLDMSRIEGGALRPEKEWYPVSELIFDVLDRMHLFLQNREIRTCIPDDIPPVELDYLQMDQVLTNLIENAIRYTPPSSPLEIHVRVTDNELVVCVADRGPGVAPEDQERIFDKFYRVMGVPRMGIRGSGLGLAVCRGLVEAHDGRIWVENRDGCGANFCFTLPIAVAEGRMYE